ncbi:MAG TPA: hypothetical protein DCQ14_03820 [Firmicutes bacterium]|nr:hypothetical protein [Bacillota bacterium]
MPFRWLNNRKWAFARNKRGSVLPLVSISMAALLGFSAIVMDYGAAALLRRRLVTAADAAALAGAQELIRNNPSPALARSKAAIYAELNGVAAAEITASISPDLKEITVHVEDDLAFNFARIFGLEGMNLNARARAVVGPVATLSGIVPFSIVEQELRIGAVYTLKYSDWKEAGLGPGSYGALALGGSGANRYRKNIKDGFNSPIRIGDILNTKQGNMSGPTRQGILHRIGEAGNCGCTPENIQPGCPLLIYIPIVRDLPGKKVEVVNFAAFYIDRRNPPGSGNDSIVSGTFVRSMVDGPVAEQLTGYGVYAVNLVE